MALLNEEIINITPEEISQQGLEALDDKYQKSVGFFAWDFFIAIGKILYKVWEQVIYIANCLTDLNNMTYEDVVKFIYQMRGLEAKVATASSGLLTVTNGSGTIYAGDIFETASGIQFKAVSSNYVKLGGTFEVECLTKGTIGNVPANSITIIPTTIQGIVSVKNIEAFTNGYDDEPKEDLIERYYLDLKTPATSGNKYHYKKWALSVTGVGKAKVKPLWNGNNTVKVVILDSNGNLASKQLIADVQNFIDPYKLDIDNNKVGWGCGNGEAPIGAYCTVTTAELLNINFSIKAKKKANFSEEVLKQNISKKLNDYIEANSFTDEEHENGYYELSYAKLLANAAIAEGIEDIDNTNFLVNGQKENIKVLDNNQTTQIPVIENIEIEYIL